jgi:hypothetical protein
MRVFAFTVLLGLLAAGPASAVGTPPTDPPVTPLRLSIASPDGKPTIRLAREMTVLATCSKACRAKVSLVLRTPTNTLRLSRTGRRAATVPWASTVALSDYGFDYLSMVWRSSSLRVVVTATDIATSRRTVRTKTFRLRLR